MAHLLTSSVLSAVPHGFSTREEGGAAEVLPGSRLLTVKQVHSPHVAIVDEKWDNSLLVEADAMVTAARSVVLGIVTADCAPILFADPVAGVIGAAHAGWRGAHGGVLENTVSAMAELGAEPERIQAAIGPCIHQANYEVDAAFRENFDNADDGFFEKGREGHWQFDLPAYVAARLVQAGVAQPETMLHDTYADPGRFHSYRRSTHRGEATEGRQISLIGLRESA